MISVAGGEGREVESIKSDRFQEIKMRSFLLVSYMLSSYFKLVVPAQNARDTKTIVMSYCVNTLKFEHYFTSLHINKDMITHSY